jgi:cysteinyl-tRNA synthetase
MSTPVLTLYNTLTRTKEPFVPLDPQRVRMYVCGPTVYDYAHIGNARPAIVFDVLFRLLKHLYGEAHVTYVSNITDVDDKINARALERWTRTRPLLAEMRALTEATNAQYRKDLRALNVLDPTHTPRATDYVCNGEQPQDMVRIIARLIERGVAYAAEGHVLFSPSAMDALPGAPKYGQLSRRNFDEMLAGARVDVAPYKRDPMDFVLWKPSNRETEPGWDSPGGYGRPGWHIECSAMAGALLGETFDIHGGGIDLVFPHHENEIAQSCCAFGVEKMASVFMHNGFLQVEGQKMSKSLGNFVTIDELLNTEKFGGRKWPGEVIRLAMLKTHYRQPIDWTVARLREAASELEKLQKWYLPPSGSHYTEYDKNHFGDEFGNAIIDDVNIVDSIRQLHMNVSFLQDRSRHATHEHVRRLSEHSRALEVLGLAPSMSANAVQLRAAGQVQQLITARLEARRAKNFAESDRIRDELAAMGIALKDGKDPVTGEPTTTWEVKR